ncbi:MAG: hypothetical protein M1546_16090 [Chloroflexi bacterium]|nr:hypothetical protein [Chloroflexota bacterium]
MFKVSPAVRLVKLTLLLAGMVSIVAGWYHFVMSWMDLVAPATVIGVRRDFGGDRLGSNYQIYYQFLTVHKRAADGSFVVENPMTIGDVPRVGSFLQVRYSSRDPHFNSPLSGSGFDLSGAVVAEFLWLVGLVLLWAAWKAT